MELRAATLLVILTSLLSSASGVPSLSVDVSPSNYGTSNTLKCTDATYTSGDGYFWQKDSVTIFNNAGEISTTGKYSESIDGRTFKLVINDIDKNDEGTYTCNHNFDDSNALDLEVESRGNVTAELLSSKYLEVTFQLIYPNASSATITCDSTAVAGKFVTSVEDGDRFINTWQSTITFTTKPTSCSASVELRTTVNTVFTVTSVVIPIIVVLLLLWHKIVIAISCYLLGSFGSGMILGLNVIKTTCCCACFYEGESCKDCVSNNCECKCCDETPCGACFNIKGLPSWYKILWLSIIGSPVAFGMWVVMKCCRQGRSNQPRGLDQPENGQPLQGNPV